MTIKLNTTMIVVAMCTLVLTGCTSTTDTTTDTTNSTPTTKVIQTTSNGIEVLEITSDTMSYNGEHGGTRGRQNDSVTAIITLDKNKIITAVVLDQVAGEPKSRQYQSAFNNAIATEIVGKSINDVQIGIIGGASNTSEAFNRALENIKSKVI